MRRTLVLSVLAVSLVAGACGGGGASATASYCQALRDAGKKAAPQPLGATTTSLSLAGTRTAADKTLDSISKKAPSELKGDYAVLREYIDVYLSVRADPNADRSRLTALQSKASTASRHISDYNQRVCKFVTTTTIARAAVTTPTTAPPTTTSVKSTTATTVRRVTTTTVKR